MQRGLVARKVIVMQLEVEGFAKLDEHVRNVAQELFEGVGYAPCFLRSDNLPRTVGKAISASIGFTCPGGRGSISLLGSPQVVVILRGDADRASPSDVMGEFCNMLMGRFKNRMHGCGVDLSGTLPTVATGDNVELQTTPDTASLWHEVKVPVGSLYIRLEAVLDANFQMRDESLDGEPVTAVEGECFLF